MATFNKNIVDFRNMTEKDIRETGNILYMLLSDVAENQIDDDLRMINMNKTVKSSDWVDFSKYCFDNIDVNYSKTPKLTCRDEDKPELFGELIDVIEDWLDSKGIKPSDIPCPDRPDNDESAAIIYGEDYDILANQFANILGVLR